MLTGSAGNDHYYVQNTGDQVVEQPGEGTDFVHSSVDFTLPDNVEHMYLTGTADINGTGNALRNTIRDNAGINILAGGAGIDSYVVQNTGDQVVEQANEGIDYVSSTRDIHAGSNVETPGAQRQSPISTAPAMGSTIRSSATTASTYSWAVTATTSTRCRTPAIRS